MLIALQSVPLTQDPRFVIACIRACVWAGVEGRPFCLLPTDYERPEPLRFPPRRLCQTLRHHCDSPGLT